VPAGQAIRALIPIPVQSMTRTSFTVRLASAMESGISAEDATAFPPVPPEPGPDDADPSNDSLVWTVEESGLPDLEVLPGRVEATPAHQTEGVTILVRGFVRNRGRGRSQPCVAAMYPDGDTAFSSQLRSLAGMELAPIPALEPGQVWPFLLRWDPQGNLGTEAIRVRVDAHDVLVEPRKDNNDARVPLAIRSKFMLGAGGMAIGEALAPSPELPAGGLTMQARVTNEGQTDARRVMVYFYRDEDQVEANLIGERLVDVVPAGETVVVEFVWDLRGVDLQQAVRPSFAFGIKGSLMRLSSVAAP
jgi:hypothetical protein